MMIAPEGLIEPSGWSAVAQILFAVVLLFGVHGGMLYGTYRLFVRPAPPRKLCVLLSTLQMTVVILATPFAMRLFGNAREQALLAPFDMLMVAVGVLIVGGVALAFFQRDRRPHLWGGVQILGLGWTVLWWDIMREGLVGGLIDAAFKGGGFRERLGRMGMTEAELGQKFGKFRGLRHLKMVRRWLVGLDDPKIDARLARDGRLPDFPKVWRRVAQRSPMEAMGALKAAGPEGWKQLENHDFQKMLQAPKLHPEERQMVIRAAGHGHQG